MKVIEVGDSSPATIDRFQALQWAYARRLVSRRLAQSVEVLPADDYDWPQPPCRPFGRRKDNDYKHVPAAE